LTFKKFIEVNNKMIQYIQSLVPSWPLYIISDLVARAATGRSPQEIDEFLQMLANETGYNNPKEMNWNLENITITKDIFDSQTIARMEERGMGQSNPYQVPNDAERHQGANTRLKQNPNIKVHGYSGPSNSEPIILIQQHNKKYELLEGWHRTIQMILEYPKGYQQKAYVVIVK